MRLINADKIYPDVRTQHGALAISQGQLAYAETVNAILIPDNATNGDMLTAVFGEKAFITLDTHNYLKDWWNAPYKAESKGDKE